MKLRYAVVFEQTPNNYGAYAPDVPGCISTGKTWDKIQEMIREALTFHIEGMVEDGEPIPEPKMSIDGAIAHHSRALEEWALDIHHEYSDPVPSISTTFQMVEVDVAIPQPAKA